MLALALLCAGSPAHADDQTAPAAAGTPAPQAVAKAGIDPLGRPAAPPSKKAADRETGNPSESIVVVGERIGALRNTNSAVTVLHDLDPSEYRSVYDVANRVPNMIGNASDIPTIRGAAGSGASGGIFTLMSGARPRTATLIDGLPETYGGQRYIDSGLWDMDSVQVLRGPQATTQGRNAVGGAIQLKTKDPTQFWEGAVRGGYESEGDKGALAAMLSGPIVTDELAVRVAADGVRGSSYIKYAGKGWPFDPDRIDQTTVRGKALWTPRILPRLRVEVIGSHREQKGEYLFTATGPDFFRNRFDNPDMNTRVSDSSIDTASVDASYRINAWLTEHLLYGHVWYDSTFRQANQEGAPNTLGKLNLKEQNNTVENRLVYAPGHGRLDGAFGLYYYNRHQDLTSDLGVNGPDREDTYAAYADGTVHLVRGLSLLLGARVEREEQNRDVALSWGRVQADLGTTMFLPKGGLLYRFTPVTTASFTVRRGYNPGGGAIDWDNGTYYQYDKETVTTYELAGHTELLHRRLSLNSNLFYNDYHNYQDLVNYTFVNVPGGRSLGLEMEAIWRPAYGLEVSAGLGLLDTKITDAPLAYPAVRGSKFSLAPSTTFNLAIEKRFTSGIFMGMNLNRVGSYQSQVESGSAITAGNYTVLNAHVGYETKHYAVRVYARNLTDEHILYAARTNWAGSQAQIGQPLAFGVTLDGRF